MGGLAGGRYIGNRANRGKTTGDVIGGGGRSVMPRRIDAERRNAMARFNSAQNELQRQYEQFQAATQQPRGPLVPPGGGYSGGVIPRFQTGGQMQSITSGPPQAPSPPSPSDFRYGFEHSGNYPWMPQSWQDRMAGLRTSVSARSLPQKLQQFQTRSGPNVTDILKEQPAWWPESARGWRAWQIPRRGIEGHSVGVAPTGTRNLSGSGGRGGYSGGVVPRFQAGGGAVGYSHGGVFPRHGSVTKDPTIQGAYSIWKRGRTIGDLMGGGGRSIMPTRRRGNYNFNRSELYPNWSAGGTGVPVVPRPGGGGGLPVVPPGGGYSGGVVPSFQTGGQLEDPLFPVESELADESPWYPDEDVGYEESAPMQGGFDIFGRSGG